MAAVWGASWGRAWGNAWGVIQVTVPAEEEQRIYSGACFPFGSTDELVRIHRRRRRRDNDLVFLGL